MNIETRIASLDHLFFVEQSHGLSFTFELQSVDKLISQDSMRAKLNNHRMTLGSKLHLREVVTILGHFTSYSYINLQQ